jgi:hypothetical protein
MPKTAKEFLSDWLTRHVKPIPYPMQPEIVTKFVMLCEGDAGLEGITRGELAEAAGGKLKPYIAKAMESAWDAEVKKNKRT